MGEFVGVLWKMVRFLIDYILVIVPTAQSLRHGYAVPLPLHKGGFSAYRIGKQFDKLKHGKLSTFHFQPSTALRVVT